MGWTIKYKTVNLKQVYLAICPPIKVCFGVCVCALNHIKSIGLLLFLMNSFMVKKKCTAVTDQALILVMYTAQGNSLLIH